MYAMKKGGVTMDMLESHHLFTVQEVLVSIAVRETATDASVCDTYELEEQTF
jgi:hypothetical protein